jgi:Tol biopolymer transport system component
MDRDGSNAHQIYPSVGENSRFGREEQIMDWSPDGRDIAFIYDNSLYIYRITTDESVQITRADNIISNPTWAPYGRGTDIELSGDSPSRPIPIPLPGSDNLPFD